MSFIGLHLQVIIDSQPLTVAIIASIFFGETIGVFGVLGLATGVIGLLLLEVFTTCLFNNIAMYSVNLYDGPFFIQIQNVEFFSMLLRYIRNELYKNILPVQARSCKSNNECMKSKTRKPMRRVSYNFRTNAYLKAYFCLGWLFDYSETLHILGCTSKKALGLHAWSIQTVSA